MHFYIILSQIMYLFADEVLLLRRRLLPSQFEKASDKSVRKLLSLLVLHSSGLYILSTDCLFFIFNTSEKCVYIYTFRAFTTLSVSNIIFSLITNVSQTWLCQENSTVLFDSSIWFFIVKKRVNFAIVES